MVAEAPKIEKPRGTRIPILTRTKVRNLYLYQDASHERIALETGLTIKAVGQLIVRGEWAKEKRAREKRLMEKTDARMAANVAEVVEAIASEAEQHAMSGLAKVGASLERTDEFAAKDFQSYTAGVKNLVSIARECRAPANADQPQAGNTLNLFVLRAGDVVAPAAQISEAKQVTEIESKPIAP